MGAVDDPTWVEAWSAALDDLELSVQAAERVLHGDDVLMPAWSPPTLPGPLPLTLADRARALLARQQDVSGAIAQAALGTQRQREVAARIGAATRPAAGPAYLDVTA